MRGRETRCAPISGERDLPPVDLVLADPPYREDLADRLLDALAEAAALRPDGRVAIEHEPGADAGRQRWETVRERRYGDTAYHHPARGGRSRRKGIHMRKGIFPGTFDPVTEGHLDILNRALQGAGPGGGGGGQGPSQGHPLRLRGAAGADPPRRVGGNGRGRGRWPSRVCWPNGPAA